MCSLICNHLEIHLLVNLKMSLKYVCSYQAKVEIFGDIQAEHKDEWEGAVTMIEYLNLTIRSVYHIISHFNL